MAAGLREHLENPVGREHVPADARTGVAGGAPCGDLITIALRVEGDRVADAGFTAHGCGTMQAAGSAAVTLARGEALLDAARVSGQAIAQELGGLSPGKFHAADLAADALHQALGAAARDQAQLAERPGRTLVAMSGGVDSAVALLLCGPEAVAVTLELWRDPENDAEASCCSASAVRVARSVAHAMGLPHLTLDLREEFRAGVVEPFLDAHAEGETPNPCVRCNGFVRLAPMVALSRRLGAGGGLATGHYARKTHEGLLRAAADPAKDQAYMLAAVPEDILDRLSFPLGDLHKSEVRALAREHGIAVADRAESQDLCFLAGVGKRRFLERHLPDEPGDVVRDGVAVARHAGSHHFTVGQRKGLGVSAPEPLYVLRKQGTRVHLGTRTELVAASVALRDVVLRRPAHEVDAVKLRYRTRPLPCRLTGETLALTEPADAAVPGQVAVLYRGDAVVGHGTIAS